jgi:hypothetical protein
MQFFSFTDIILPPVVFAIILFFAKIYARNKQVDHPEYRYFINGLLIKLFGGLSLCFVYTLYYPGGDTVQYYRDGLCFVRLLFTDPSSFLIVLTKKASFANLYYFNADSGYPAYFRDPKAWFVVKITFLIVFFSMQSFVVATLLTASISFVGVWKLYKVFISEFPELHREFAIALFYIPSVFFWGSGILKDTFTFSALGFFVYSFYMIFIQAKKIPLNLLTLTLSSYIIISIKPYILVGLMPAVLIWIIHRQLMKIHGSIARTAAIPILVVLGLIIGYGFMSVLGNALAEYSLDTVLDKALITQQDLKMDYYKGNSFDIGHFDATIHSMASKLPIAIFTAIFRPFITETNNIVMFISSIENLVILVFTIRVLMMVRVFGVFRYIFRHHMLTFAFIFSMFFAFSVGISTSNFGSLVRYKIPAIPFFVASLYIIRYMRQKEIDEEKVIQLTF